MTRWQCVHLFGHFVLGFLFPMFAGELLLATTLFEVYEYVSCNCHDVTDLVYNVVGTYLGVALRRRITIQKG